MKKLIGVALLIIFGFCAYANFSQINAREDYIEACLYIMNSQSLKDSCYDVYPKNHKSSVAAWGAVCLIGALIGMGLLASRTAILHLDSSASNTEPKQSELSQLPPHIIKYVNEHGRFTHNDIKKLLDNKAETMSIINILTNNGFAEPEGLKAPLHWKMLKKIK